jgi:hypothetical protein
MGAIIHRDVCGPISLVSFRLDSRETGVQRGANTGFDGVKAG